MMCLVQLYTETLLINAELTEVSVSLFEKYASTRY